MLFDNSLTIKSYPHFIRLIVVNLIPVIGVLFFDWSLFFIFFYFWLENGVIGLFNVFKIVIASIVQKQKIGAFLAPFFVVHFGGFMAGHLFFLMFFFTFKDHDPFFEQFNGPSAEFWWLVGINLLSIIFGYTISFIEFLRQKVRTVKLELLFFSPYPRILIMHFTIMFGGVILLFFNTPVFALIVLILAKAVVDSLANKIKFS